jgi:hypothetical protein
LDPILELKPKLNLKPILKLEPESELFITNYFLEKNCLELRV